MAYCIKGDIKSATSFASDSLHVDSKLNSQPILLRRPRPPPTASVVTRHSTAQASLNQTQSVPTEAGRRRAYWGFNTALRSSSRLPLSIDGGLLLRRSKSNVAAENNKRVHEIDKCRNCCNVSRGLSCSSVTSNYVQHRHVVTPYSVKSSCDNHLSDWLNSQLENTAADGPMSPSRLLQRTNVQETVHVQPPEFSISNIVEKLSKIDEVPVEVVVRVMYSRHNYKKLQRLLAETFLGPPQESVHILSLNLPGDQEVIPRVPLRHLLLQLATLLQQQMSADTGKKMRAKLQTIRRYQTRSGTRGSSIVSAPDIVVYEDPGASRASPRAVDCVSTSPGARGGKESVVSASRTRYFQGAQRSSSPFLNDEEERITPAEVAVLDSLMNGGTSLSLKAHFFTALPDIELLLHTLTYLNLSYNNLVEIPAQVVRASNLTVLKMRNNPLRTLSSDIASFVNLRTLVVSYCLIESLPPELFQLKRLEVLDLAYNKLITLPGTVSRLGCLRELVLEGNRLPGLPPGVLTLKRLWLVSVSNNFMHPIFWQESNQPQRLQDMARLALWNSSTSGVCADVRAELRGAQQHCDCCGGVRFGAGLRAIRPVPRLCGVANVPIVFQSCSVQCLKEFSAKIKT